MTSKEGSRWWPHQGESPVDVRQEGILLRLVEAVDLVNEKHGAAAKAAGPRMRHDFFDLLDAAQHRAEWHEVALRDPGHEEGEGRLTRAGRTPQNGRADIVAFDPYPQGLARSEDMLLAHELLQAARAHPVGQRGLGDLGRVRGAGVEEAHGLPRCRLAS
jgi:hypothetical protein